MVALLLRNIEPAPALPSGFAHPEHVPASLSDDVLAAVLRAGRPQGDAAVLTVNGVGCATVTAGRGAPILCVHGLGHDAWDWGAFFVRCANPAAPRARLTALDLPGFGLGDKPAEPTSGAWDLSLLVAAVVAAAENIFAATGERPVVVASSLGGHVTILAALERPELFRKLFLCAPGGLVAVSSPMQRLLRAYYSVDAIAGRPEHEVVANSHKIFAAHGLAVDNALAARKLSVRRSARAREFAVPFAGIVDDVFQHVVMDRVTQLRMPTMIVVGERDVVVSPDSCATAARRLHGRFLSMPGIGHCPHLEAPDAFAEVALSFALS